MEQHAPSDSSDSLFRRNELQPEDADDDQSDAGEPERAGALAEQDDA